MSADAVLEDALREAGCERVTVWHLRCLQAYLDNCAKDPMRPGYAFDRLLHDVRFSLEYQHVEAQFEDGVRTAARSVRARTGAGVEVVHHAALQQEAFTLEAGFAYSSGYITTAFRTPIRPGRNPFPPPPPPGARRRRR